MSAQTFVYAYAHVRPNDKESEDKRWEILENAAKNAFPSHGKLTLFREASDLDSVKNALKDIRPENGGLPLQPVVWLLHLSPFGEMEVVPSGVLEEATGATNRLHIVFVSGGGLNESARGLKEAIQRAEDKNFGGCTYWPLNIDESTNELVEFLCKLPGFFANAPTPHFDQFAELIRSRPIPAIILDQLLLELSRSKHPQLEKLLAKHQADPSGLWPSLSSSANAHLTHIIEDRVKFEQLRSRLRHHDLNNSLLLTVRNALSEKPDHAAIVEAVKELEAKIKRYSGQGEENVLSSIEGEMQKICELANSLDLKKLCEVLEVDVDQRVSNDLNEWKKNLSDSTKQLKESADKVLGLKGAPDKEILRRFEEACLKCIDSLKAPDVNQ